MFGIPLLVGLVCFVGACASSALTPRLPGYLHAQIDTAVSGITFHAQHPIDAAVSVISDDSVPGSAPALPDAMSSILRNRLIQQLQQELPINPFPLGAHESLGSAQDSGSLFKAVERVGRPYLIVAMLSSVETESATHLGSQPLMTQMPGLSVENFALAELALVHMESKHIVFQAEGRSSETMEELTVPFGDSNASGVTGREILRANAAQAALDHALKEFTRRWEQRS